SVEQETIMSSSRLWTLAILSLLGAGGELAAQPSPSYAKQVKPFLARYCSECHSGTEPDGGFNLETYKALLQGGAEGAVLVPGKPDESRMVLMVEGKKKPTMPPKRAKQPTPEEAAVLRAWVAAGAKDDGGAAGVTLPVIKPRAPVAAPVTALAYRPDGKRLAAALHQGVAFLDPQNGEPTGKLQRAVPNVTALDFSKTHRLAVASGSAGVTGTIRVCEL